MRFDLRLAVIPLTILGLLILLLAAERRPFLFANVTYIGAIIAVEVIAVCLWHYEKVFLPMTAWCFLAAGIGLPFAIESFTLRWLFLGVGALVGFTLWMRTTREAHFGVFHLIALFCIFSAVASASSSGTAKVGLLKAGSLFLLFLYASTGARLAIAGREEAFVRGLAWAAEISAFVSTAAYVTGYPLFGNPNNRGAFIGVIVTPVLLWAVLTAEDRGQRQHRAIALALCGALLYFSVCRAAIVADFVVAMALTIALRRPGLLVKTVFVGLLFLEIMAVANPSRMGEFMDSLSGKFIFKNDGRRQTGIFGSRESPWDTTIAAVKKHPLFGTGFGTSDLGDESIGRDSTIYTLEGSNREHGSSYLAMAEYMGLLGIVPFLFLLFLVIRAVAQVFAWMHRARSPAHCAVPLALIVAAGLVHAVFEDWLFAIGSYLCVFFWVAAFLLVDMAGKKAEMRTVPTISGFVQAPAYRQSA